MNNQLSHNFSPADETGDNAVSRAAAISTTRYNVVVYHSRENFSIRRRTNNK